MRLRYDRFGASLEVWSIPAPQATEVAATQMQAVSHIALQESVPIEKDARTKGPRSMQWHPCHAAALLWVEALDGGDPKVRPARVPASP